LDDFGQVPRMAGESGSNSRWPVLPPFGQRGVSIVAPTGAWALVPAIVAAPMTQVDGTNELMTQIHDA
jgi:hypothetical protein